ncbi:RluA family pseudouridine synthase [Thiomicrospira sp. WB1]|uniref:RluA family pseudouridine synthase n=1 Tax=Thiomicrospira sp. WB1 TaxID=1685380 RepID=UPI000AE8D93E|nr:RluA family pseudouridine synthase [Thiomicrospira sp. WB1]
MCYEDDWLLVVSKPSGLLSVPGRTRPAEHSLIGQIQLAWPDARIVHRLDMDTSGLMVLARDADTHRALSRSFERRQISKTYQAWCFGMPSQQQGTLQLPQICDWPNRPRQKIDMRQGKATHTDWALRTETLCLDGHHHAFEVTLSPTTGRSHQLRLQMASLGHPILGDNLYAPERIQRLSSRLMLHACHLSFMHPLTQQPLCFDYPLSDWHKKCFVTDNQPTEQETDRGFSYDH